MDQQSHEIVLIGYSGHAYVVIDILQNANYTIKGYLDKTENLLNPYKLNYLGTEDTFDWNTDKASFVIAIGDNRIRAKLYNFVKAKGKHLFNVVDPTAIISKSAKTGEGVMIMPGVVMNAFASIGNGVVLNSNCVLEHECKVGNFVHIAPGAVVAGNVTIGDNVFIGAGAVIKQGLTIGSNSIIGAGAVVLKNAEENQTIVGNPGRPLVKS